MLSQDHSDGFAADSIDHPASNGVLGEQADCPACTPLRRWTADQSHQRSLLGAVQFRLVLAAHSWLLAQSVVEALLDVAMRDARHLAPIRTERGGGRVQSHASVQHQQRLHPSPDSCRALLTGTLPAMKLPAVPYRQPQPLEPFCPFHPSL